MLLETSDAGVVVILAVRAISPGQVPNYVVKASIEFARYTEVFPTTCAVVAVAVVI